MGLKSRISLQLLETYRRTLYWVKVHPKSWAIRIGRPSRQILKLYKEEGFSSAAFITAYNPRSQKTPRSKNLKAQRLLLEQIRQKGYAFISGVGKDPQGQWASEPSFLVLGISLKEAKALGKNYGQNAIVFAGKNTVSRLVLLR